MLPGWRCFHRYSRLKRLLQVWDAQRQMLLKTRLPSHEQHAAARVQQLPWHAAANMCGEQWRRTNTMYLLVANMWQHAKEQAFGNGCCAFLYHVCLHRSVCRAAISCRRTICSSCQWPPQWHRLLCHWSSSHHATNPAVPPATVYCCPWPASSEGILRGRGSLQAVRGEPWS